jgi:hypothetical protein
MVCKPKDKRGLGIVNFQKQNVALLVNFLDRFCNKCELLWVQLIWSAYYDGKIPHAEKLCGSFCGEMYSSKWIIIVVWLLLRSGEGIHFISGLVIGC